MIDDCINRQQAIDAVKNTLSEYEGDYDCRSRYGVIMDSVENLKKLPPIQPERKKGTWTKDASCPFCGFKPWYERDIHTLSFCPNCGADMKGKTNE